MFTDRGVSGKLAGRPELDKALATLEAGDVLTVWKLDRLGPLRAAPRVRCRRAGIAGVLGVSRPVIYRAIEAGESEAR